MNEPTKPRGGCLALTASLAALVALALILAVPAALGVEPTEQTRDTYTEAVEPICKANTEANERILGDVKRQVKQGKLKPAAAQFAKAARALKRTVVELEAVPQPAADQARLTAWLDSVKAEAGLFEAVARKLRSGDKVGAQREVVRLNSNANRANNKVLPFGFTYCRFQPSRFT